MPITKGIRHVGFTLLALLLLWNIACDEQGRGDDSETEDEEFHISLDGSMKMSQMESSEAYQLCMDIAEGINKVIDEDIQCLRIGITAGQSSGNANEEVCNEAFLSCIGKSAENYQTCNKFKETNDKYKDCDAKVSEMDNCMRNTISTLKDSYEDLSCASAEMKDPGEFEQCEACQNLEEQCPGVTTNFDRQF